MHGLDSHQMNGVEIFQSPLVEALGFVHHAFSSRQGGVSEGRFASLNLGRARGEDSESVQENRRRFFAAAGIEPERLAEVRQVHGADVCAVETGGSLEGVRADGLMTDAPGTVVSVKTADCVPVLIADMKQKAVAAAHAGWRGTAAGILEETVRGMGARYGSRPRDLVAALGPAISRPCYEVGGECLPPFRDRFADWRSLFAPLGRDKWLLDLPGAVRRQLVAAGVPEAQIGQPGPCTFSESVRFYSYRREGPPVGRLMSVIGIF